jgi:hypothetical protein
VPAEDSAGTPVERDNEAWTGSAAADMLDRGEQPVICVSEVSHFTADGDLALERPRGEVEAQKRSVTHRYLTVGESDPERVATDCHRAGVVWNTESRGHAAGGEV